MSDAALCAMTERARDPGVAARAIRFHEEKGRSVPRRAGVTRAFTSRGCTRMILCLCGDLLGRSLNGIAAYLELCSGDLTRRAQLSATIDDALAERDDFEAQAEAALNAPAAPRRWAAGRR